MRQMHSQCHDTMSALKRLLCWKCLRAGLTIPREMEQILQESRDSVREAKIQLVMLDQRMVTRCVTRLMTCKFCN